MRSLEVFGVDNFTLPTPFQRAAVLRANADPDDSIPGDGGVPRAADRGDVTAGLPLEAAGGERPAADARDAAHQPLSAAAHPARSRGRSLPL